jgi:hypothetical protein
VNFYIYKIIHSTWTLILMNKIGKRTDFKRKLVFLYFQRNEHHQNILIFNNKLFLFLTNFGQIQFQTTFLITWPVFNITRFDVKRYLIFNISVGSGMLNMYTRFRYPSLLQEFGNEPWLFSQAQYRVKTESYTVKQSLYYSHNYNIRLKNCIYKCKADTVHRHGS